MKIEKKELNPTGNVYKKSNPFLSKVLRNERITAPQSSDDIRHIVFDITGSKMAYLEGQSIGIIPPGSDETGKTHRMRLYSISSPADGDSADHNTLSLTVKRVRYLDSQSGQEIIGVGSNYLCDLQPGESVELIGPVGRNFFLPVDPKTNLIMVSVGTGIAPFRAFIHHIYRDHKHWQGSVRLYHGSKSGMESLYMNDQNNDIGAYYEERTFQAFKALSSVEHKYVQHKLEENQDEVWQFIKEGNFSFYLCGLKGVEDGINEVFEAQARGEGLDWNAMRDQFKEEGRWNIEVY